MSESLESWIDLSLFYVLAQREDSDPEWVGRRAIVLFGEGTWIAAKERASRRVEKLGSGIQVIRIVDQYPEVRSLLTASFFDHQKERFTTGLVERPPVIGLPDQNGVIGVPFRGSCKLHQFVRLDKQALLHALVPGVQESEAARRAIAVRLDAILTVTSRAFSHDQLRWFGDVLIAERFRGHVYWRPVHSADAKSCRELEVVVANSALKLSVQLRAFGTDDMCLTDRLLEWRDNDCTPKRIQFHEELGLVQLRVWVDGLLAQEESSSVHQGFNGKILTGSGSAISLQDRLTQKLENAVKGGAASIATLDRATKAGGRQMAIAFGHSMTDEVWSGLNVVQDQLFDLVRPRPPQFSYFPARAEGRAQAILHFANLISTADQAYLVDPFFDAIGASDLLPRLSGDGHLTIVTNLPIDHVAHVDKLAEYLEALGRTGLAYQLRVLCLSPPNGSARQVFHDRYLLTRRGTTWRGFVLTNSFSGLATQYSLFVVEAPLGTTAQLLDEFENLVSTVSAIEQIWPPNRSGNLPKEAERHRSFPYSHAMLARVASYCTNDTDKLIRLGAARGFINHREDDWNWYSNEERTKELLEWLMPLRERGHRRWRRRGTTLQRRSFDVGTAVHILGDLHARGLRVAAREVAQRASSGSAEIEQRLRTTFSDPKDPTLGGPTISAQRLGLRQTLQKDVDKVAAFRAGVSAWQYLRVHPERSTHWDRIFAYTVLMLVDTQRAIRLAQELHDADFLLSLADPLRAVRLPWDSNLARALAGAESPFLRAFGIQSLALQALLAETPRDEVVATDVDSVVTRLVDEGIPMDEIAFLLLVWGQQRPLPSTNPGRALGRILKELSKDHQAAVFQGLLDTNHRSAELLADVVSGMSDDGANPIPSLLEMLVGMFGQKFNKRPKDYYFGVPHDSKMTFVIARTVGILSMSCRGPAWEVMGRLMRIDEVERDARSLSPFRWRPAAPTAETQLGELILMDLCAEGFDERNAARPLQADTAARAHGYLASPELGHSTDLRNLIRQIVGMVPGEAMLLERVENGLDGAPS